MNGPAVWSSRQVVGMVICLLAGWLLLAGCNHPAASAPAPVAPLQVTPSAVTGELTPAPSLADAANQLADALDVSPAAVRVRIRPRGCTVCSEDENRAATSVAGLAVEEAAARLQAGDDLWLFVQQLTCQYHFDGKALRPQQCQLAPI